jgi:hypothetical protein
MNTRESERRLDRREHSRGLRSAPRDTWTQVRLPGWVTRAVHGVPPSGSRTVIERSPAFAGAARRRLASTPASSMVIRDTCALYSGAQSSNKA